MIEGNSKTIQYIEQYYFDNISMYNFKSEYQIFITEDICGDCKIFENDLIVPEDTMGIVLIPNGQEQIIILINNKANIDIYIHELTHAYDFVLFKHNYNLSNENTKSHETYKAFCFWSEFHARATEIVHNQFISYILYQPESDKYELLRNDIKTFMYSQIINAFVSNNSNTFHKFMWLFAGIYVCNKYGGFAYDIQDNIRNSIPPIYIQIYHMFLGAHDFYHFLEHADNLTTLLNHQ